jgi:hypothetical protein
MLLLELHHVEDGRGGLQERQRDSDGGVHVRAGWAEWGLLMMLQLRRDNRRHDGRRCL